MIRMLTNLRLAKRLAVSFGSLTVLALVIAVVAWWGVAEINTGLKGSAAEAGRMLLAKQVMQDAQDIYLHMWQIAGSKEVTKKQANKDQLGKVRESYLKTMTSLKDAAKSDEETRLLTAVETALSAARDANTRAEQLSFAGKESEATALLAGDGAENREKIESAVQAFVDWRQERLKDTQDAAAKTVTRVEAALGAAILTVLVLALTFGVLITRSISGPMRATVEVIDRIGNGDLTRDIPAELCARQDEAGDLARSMHEMSVNLRSLLRDLSGGIQTLASSSTELTAISSATSREAKNMSEKATTVAAAAEESSANTVSVAASMEQASTNLASVATATEEMSATVADIASNSEKARAISEQAIGQTHTISALMQQLGNAAQEIGKVTETINDISSQTNLLALNATIEAARAGAAGKGFAVVANEIKELARQTAAATEDIKAKISGVQNSAGSAIADIEKIASVINEVGGIVANIAAAIEEQATVTKDVAGNIAQASAGVKDANTRVAETATVASSIAQDIASVNKAVTDFREAGEQVQASATELSMLAEQLQSSTQKFQFEETGGVRRSAGKSEAAGAAKVFVPWKPEYSVGVQSMDAQHKRLLDMINRLHSALKRGEGATATGAILKDLLQYTEHHFAEEEEMLESIHYAGLGAQRQAHQTFVGKVKDAHRRWEQGDPAVAQDAMNLLSTWLPQHIVKMDKQYASLARKA